MSEHELVRAGLKAVLGEVVDVRPPSTPLTAVAVAIYDTSGLATSSYPLDLLVRQPDLPVLALFFTDRHDAAEFARARGADGLLSADWSRYRLRTAVLAAASGPPRSDRSAASRATPPVDPLPLALTPREWEVLRLIATGRSNLDIAGELGLSINSIKTYIRGAYRRIGVERRSQAMIWCFDHGLASPVETTVTTAGRVSASPGMSR